LSQRPRSISRQRAEQKGRCVAVAGLLQIGQGGEGADGAIGLSLVIIWGHMGLNGADVKTVTAGLDPDRDRASEPRFERPQRWLCPAMQRSCDRRRQHYQPIC